MRLRQNLDFETERMSQQVFWKSRKLHEMTPEQWESVCDGCGKCCLHKLQDEDTEEMAYTCIACQYLDHQTGRCQVYSERQKHVPDCLDLSVDNLGEVVTWLPDTCSYRLLYQGEELPEWHHLVSGDTDTIHRCHMSVLGKVVSENDVDEEDWLDYRID